MTHAARIPLYTLAPANLKAMIALSQSTRNSSLGARLVELVQLRVSQLNGCGVCVDMHWRDLVRQGLDPRHLNALAAWREAPFFSERERAALAWADAVNALPGRDDTDSAWPALREHFSDVEIAELAYTIAAIRGWNAIKLSLRSPLPEHPAPGM
jgi:AhpD family alkylhydroperoxidase